MKNLSNTEKLSMEASSLIWGSSNRSNLVNWCRHLEDNDKKKMHNYVIFGQVSEIL